MKVKAYGAGLYEREQDLIRNMARLITKDPPEIIDINCFEPEDDPDSIFFVYGSRSIKKTEALRCRARLHFPDTGKLIEGIGEAEQRQHALDKLLEFKELLDTGNTEDLNLAEPKKEVQQPKTLVTEESLPNLTAGQVKAIEATLRDKGEKAWVGTTQDGRTIRLTAQPEESTADIDMTFAELYSIRGLMEAFRVKELEIVYKPTATGRKSSNK